MKVAVIGLGLMGGSFAKALKKYTDHKVFAYDINEKSLNSAISLRSIDEILSLEDLDKMDLTVLALKAKDALKFVEDNKNITNNLMDFCGIKNSISENLQELSKEYAYTYIGAHPMAGREVGGFDNSLEDLFLNRSMILIEHGKIEAWIVKMLKDIGFSIKYASDNDQDRIIAYTSQLCHIASNAFVKSETALEHEGYSSDSLKDLTRVATIDEIMWTDLFFDNKKFLLEELDNYIDQLKKYKKALEDDDKDTMRKLLKEGKEIKAKMYPKKEKQDERSKCKSLSKL